MFRIVIMAILLQFMGTEAGAVCSQWKIQFMGDSITYLWKQYWPGEGLNNPCYLNNGVSGNTTVDLLARFQRDVANRIPRAAKVAYLIGTNDVAHSPLAPAGQLLPPNGNDYSLSAIEARLDQLISQTKALGILPIMATVPPVQTYFGVGWRNPIILQLNAWILAYGATHSVLVVDYYSALVDPGGLLKATYTTDGIHPNQAGFDVMAPTFTSAIAQLACQQ